MKVSHHKASPTSKKRSSPYDNLPSSRRLKMLCALASPERLQSQLGAGAKHTAVSKGYSINSAIKLPIR